MDDLTGLGRGAVGEVVDAVGVLLLASSAIAENGQMGAKCGRAVSTLWTTMRTRGDEWRGRREGGFMKESKQPHSNKLYSLSAQTQIPPFDQF